MGRSRKVRTAAAAPVPRLRLLPPILILVAVTAAVYLGALSNDFVNWDDDQYVYNNDALLRPSWGTIVGYFVTLGPTGVTIPNVMGNYHPLTMLSLQLDATLSSADPRKREDREATLHATVFHATSVILHVVGTVLVFLFVLELLRARPSGEGPAWVHPQKVAFATAILFGVSTLHVESVAWVSERKDVLYAAFFFLSLLLYVRYIRSGTRQLYLAALGAFLLSLLSKGQAVTLAPTLVLVDFLLRRRPTRPVLLEKIPFFVLALLFGLAAIKAQADGGNILMHGSEQPTLLRPLFAAYGLVQYAVKLLVPLHLSVHVTYARVLAQKTALLVVYLPLAVLAAAVTAWLARVSRLLAFGPLFFLLSVAPVLQLLPVGNAVMAERYSYVSSAGVYLLLALGVSWLLHRLGARPEPVYGAFAVYVMLLCVATLARIPVWSNSLTLWTAQVAVDPSSAVAYNNLATFKYNTGDKEGALADVERSIALDARFHRSRANRGVILDQMGRFDEALTEYTAALALRAAQPHVLNNRGKIRQERGDLQGALEDFTEAIAISPNTAMHYANRAEVRRALRQIGPAIEDYSRALALTPDHGWYNDRALLRIEAGDVKGALEDLTAVIDAIPDSPYPLLNRARLRAGQGQCGEARADLASALARGAALPEGAGRQLMGQCAPAGPPSPLMQNAPDGASVAPTLP